MKILIVEDDAALADALAYHLKRDGHDVDIAPDGLEGWALVQGGAYELALLDRMLPQMDGGELLQRMRKARLGTPVLMITALGSLSDRVQGLDAGADDYLVKPFQTEELLARVRALSRRPARMMDVGRVQCGELTLDEAGGLLAQGGASCRLSKREAKLLAQFLKKTGKTLPRELLLSRVWGDAPVEDAVRDYRAAAAARRIELRFVAPAAPLPLIEGDAPLLHRAINVLIDNAICYTQCEGHVEVSIQTAPQELLLQVRDDGPGVAPEHRERIFERFYRADQSRSDRAHSGLGLCIARQVAERHGGRLLLESNDTKGSRFILRLPCLPARSARR